MKVLIALILTLMVTATVGANHAQPSEATLIAWNTESHTGNLIAEFPHIEYKYVVEKTEKGNDCWLPAEDEYLKWIEGEAEDAVCYFTMKIPVWVRWENHKNWIWLGDRTTN